MNTRLLLLAGATALLGPATGAACPSLWSTDYAVALPIEREKVGSHGKAGSRAPVAEPLGRCSRSDAVGRKSDTTPASIFQQPA